MATTAMGMEETVTDRERDDIDLATAAEQSSEVEEAQEGNVYDRDEDSVEPAEQVAMNLDDQGDPDVESDLQAQIDANLEANDPEADALVDDALDIDSADEADASVAATDDEADIEAEEEAQDDDDVTPYVGPEPTGGEDEPVSAEDAQVAADVAEMQDAATQEVDQDRIDADVDITLDTTVRGGEFPDFASNGATDDLDDDDTQGEGVPDAETDADAASGPSDVNVTPDEASVEPASADALDAEADDDADTADEAVQGASAEAAGIPTETEQPLGTTSGARSEGEIGDEALSGEAFDDATAAVEEAEETEIDPYEAFRSELRAKPGKWYVIHSYAGFEKRVKSNIENRKVSMAMEDYVFQVEVPMEDVVEIKNGQRKLVNRVRIPGYVLVRMDLNEDSWSVVRHTPGVTGFVGNSHNPTPLRFEEAFSMLKSLVQIVEAPVKAGAKGAKTTARSIPQEVDFEVGETITIKEGSFAGLPGSISDIRPESGKLTVLVSLFERETPVELSFDQVTKL